MDFKEYQDKAADTAIYPKKTGLSYTTLGLVGEAGEIANKIKKVIRDNDGFVQPSTREDLKGELGDILWYVAMLSIEIGLDMDVIATENLEKLASRKKRDTLKGSGDKR